VGDAIAEPVGETISEASPPSTVIRVPGLPSPPATPVSGPGGARTVGDAVGAPVGEPLGDTGGEPVGEEAMVSTWASD
jgi:hypothetical protein